MEATITHPKLHQSNLRSLYMIVETRLYIFYMYFLSNPNMFITLGYFILCSLSFYMHCKAIIPITNFAAGHHLQLHLVLMVFSQLAGFLTLYQIACLMWNIISGDIRDYVTSNVTVHVFKQAQALGFYKFCKFVTKSLQYLVTELLVAKQQQ